MALTECPMCKTPIPPEQSDTLRTCPNPSCGADLTRWIRKPVVSTPAAMPGNVPAAARLSATPNPDEELSPFPRQAALYSLVAPLIAIAIAISTQSQIRGNRLAMMIVGCVQVLTIVAGLVLGIFALASMKKHGRERIFVKALLGTIFNGILVAFMILAIPVMIKVSQRAKEIQAERAAHPPQTNVIAPELLRPVDHGSPHVFPEQNCSIEFPASWSILDPAPKQTLITGASPGGEKVVVLIDLKIPAVHFEAAVGGMRGEMKKAAAKQKSEVVESDVTLNGISFHVLAIPAKVGDEYATAYTTSSGDDVYLLRASSFKGDPGMDAELLSIVNSFRVLKPAGGTGSVSATVEDNKSVSFRAGYLVGQLGTIVLFIWGAIWVIRKLAS